MTEALPPASGEAGGTRAPRALVILGQPGTGLLKAAARLQRGYFDDGGGMGRPAVVYEDDLRYASSLLANNPSPKAMKQSSNDARNLERAYVKALAAARRDVLLIDRGNNAQMTEAALKALKKAGYAIEVNVLAVPGEISAARALFEHEWLRQRTGTATAPLPTLLNSAINAIAPLSFTIESYKLADRIRVLDGDGIELHVGRIPLSRKRVRARDSIRREQSRALSLDEQRRCLEMLAAAAGGINRRDAAPEERNTIATFIGTQFQASPEALHISDALVAKGAAAADTPQAGAASGGEPSNGGEKDLTGQFAGLCLSTRRDARRAGKPLAIVIAGQPGAGVHKAAARLLAGYFTGDDGRGSPAVVCGEDFRYTSKYGRKLLSRHAATLMGEASAEARRTEWACLEALVGARADFAWLTSGDREGAMRDALAMMKPCGYRVEAVFLAVPGKESAAMALFEYEWLKQRTGIAFMPHARCHNDHSLRLLHDACVAIEEGRLASRIRVLDGEGGELCASALPLLRFGFEARPHGALQRGQSRPLSTDGHRRCMDMLSAAADSMDSRDATPDERRAVASFIRNQFPDDPEALYISRAVMAKCPPKGVRRRRQRVPVIEA
jgi:hypothetical protein